MNLDYKYLVALVGINKETKETVRGGYKLFKERDPTAIEKYGRERAKEVNIDLQKIEIYSLETKLVDEIKFGSETQKP